ncbi:DUF4237 domain-containing protein [Mycolicibacterium cosmeticum]|nr:DUF4237 domain-containing protein [Mycolicibacterium cosmeticum]
MVASAGDHEDAADRLGKAATVMDNAEKDSESLADDVKAILNDAAAAPAVQVNTTTNQVIPPDTSYLTDEAAAAVAAKVADLQTRIAAALARGVTIDGQLAQAISSATGVPAAKAPQPVASLSPAPPARAPAQPKTLDEALGQLAGGSGPLPPAKPRPPMDPAEAERAKALLRQVMANDGVPPDQIEARVDELMAKASQPLPPSVKPSDAKGPEPGFGDGFADTWFGTEQQIRNLLGQGGPGEPGVMESWGDLLKGTAEQFSGPFGPLNPAINEVKNALNSPNAAYYLGQKSAEGAMTAPTVMFGGEGALARAGLDFSERVPSDLVDPPHVADPTLPHAQAGTPLHLPPDVPPQPLPPHSPLFDGYQPVEPGPDFTHPDGSLIYPDDSLPSKPYAIEGTVISHAELPQGTALDRFGYPGGEWLSPEGTPFAERALPPGSATKPYFEYVVADPGKLPPGWRIEQSSVAPWFNQPGGGVQYRIIAPEGIDASVTELLESGYLKVKGS